MYFGKSNECESNIQPVSHCENIICIEVNENKLTSEHSYFYFIINLSFFGDYSRNYANRLKS